MPHFYCYLLDSNGDLLDVVSVDRESDSQAITDAINAKNANRECCGFQVWEDRRMVYQQGKFVGQRTDFRRMVT